MTEDRCQIVEVDGEPIRIQGAPTLTEADQAALVEIVRAAKAKLASMPPGPLSVACPSCGSDVGALCRRSDTGRVTGVHDERRGACGRGA